jgi:hypothetical protein
MNQVGVFLGGEGPNEIGSRAGHPSFQTDETPGVIQTLLGSVQQTGWGIAGAIKWSKIRKYTPNRPGLNEERNVLGLVYEAVRAEAEVVAFIRDADDDEERPKVIDAAIAKASETFPQVDVIGGAAIPVLEGWILAMRGHRGTERLGKASAQSKLEQEGIPRKDTAAMVQVASTVTLEGLPPDAPSLRRWLDVAIEVLPRRVRAGSQGGSGD